MNKGDFERILSIAISIIAEVNGEREPDFTFISTSNSQEENEAINVLRGMEAFVAYAEKVAENIEFYVDFEREETTNIIEIDQKNASILIQNVRSLISGSGGNHKFEEYPTVKNLEQEVPSLAKAETTVNSSTKIFKEPLKEAKTSDRTKENPSQKDSHKVNTSNKPRISDEEFIKQKMIEHAGDDKIISREEAYAFVKDPELNFFLNDTDWYNIGYGHEYGEKNAIIEARKRRTYITDEEGNLKHDNEGFLEIIEGEEIHITFEELGISTDPNFFLGTLNSASLISRIPDEIEEEVIKHAGNDKSLSTEEALNLINDPNLAKIVEKLGYNKIIILGRDKDTAHDLGIKLKHPSEKNLSDFWPPGIAIKFYDSENFKNNPNINIYSDGRIRITKDFAPNK